MALKSLEHLRIDPKTGHAPLQFDTTYLWRDHYVDSPLEEWFCFTWDDSHYEKAESFDWQGLIDWLHEKIPTENWLQFHRSQGIQHLAFRRRADAMIFRMNWC